LMMKKVLGTKNLSQTISIKTRERFMFRKVNDILCQVTYDYFNSEGYESKTNFM